MRIRHLFVWPWIRNPVDTPQIRSKNVIFWPKCFFLSSHFCSCRPGQLSSSTLHSERTSSRCASSLSLNTRRVTYVCDTWCVVAVTPCRRAEATATSRHRCGSPSSSRSNSVDLLATHSASMNAPSGAVLFAYSGFFLSCSWFLASRIQFNSTPAYLRCPSLGTSHTTGTITASLLGIFTASTLSLNSHHSRCLKGTVAWDGF